MWPRPPTTKAGDAARPIAKSSRRYALVIFMTFANLPCFAAAAAASDVL